jgi:hypothetical protein
VLDRLVVDAWCCLLQVELFLNSVPILKNLSSEELSRVAGALEELVFDKGARVIQQVCFMDMN